MKIRSQYDGRVRSYSAVPAGFVFLIVSWITSIVIRFGFPFDSRYSPVAQAFFAFMPWALASKALQDLAFAAGACPAPYPNL